LQEEEVCCESLGEERAAQEATTSKEREIPPLPHASAGIALEAISDPLLKEKETLLAQSLLVFACGQQVATTPGSKTASKTTGVGGGKSSELKDATVSKTAPLTPKEAKASKSPKSDQQRKSGLSLSYLTCLHASLSFRRSAYLTVFPLNSPPYITRTSHVLTHKFTHTCPLDGTDPAQDSNFMRLIRAEGLIEGSQRGPELGQPSCRPLCTTLSLLSSLLHLFMSLLFRYSFFLFSSTSYLITSKRRLNAPTHSLFDIITHPHWCVSSILISPTRSQTRIRA
jgi:hypothetical protein